MLKILIFGAKGFVGKNIVNVLQQEEYKLFLPSSKQCNLEDLEKVKSFIKKTNPNIIINAAYSGVSANIPFSNNYIFKNTHMVTNILEASRGIMNIKKIIHFSSAAEYGDSKYPINEDSPIAPKKIYGTAKAVSSLTALQAARDYLLPLVVLRVFYLYGPEDDKSVLYYLANSLLRNEQVETTKGEQVRDYMYIKDLAHVILKICLNPTALKDREIYNVGSGRGVKLNYMFKLIYFALGKKPGKKFRDYSHGEYFSQVADIKKISSAIKIKKATPMKKGIQEMILSMK